MLRHFTDSKGNTWSVWDVWPTGRSTTTVNRGEQLAGAFPNLGMSEGWLCFQCDCEKRRLTPIPPEWETCPDDTLEKLCVEAGYITRTPRDGSDVQGRPGDSD